MKKNYRDRIVFVLSALLVTTLASCPSPGGGGDSTAPSLAVASIRDRGVVHSGFLVGTVSQDADLAAVELSLDGGAWQAAALSGSGTWTFKLPSGASTWRDGTAHTIAARARDNSGNTGTAGPVAVRKGTNRDVNGDGYEDLIVGAPGYGTQNGRVYVFHSALLTGVPGGSAASASKVITGSASGLWLGSSVAAGDVNGDGYADVVAGAANYSTNIGRVYVFHSAGSAGVTITSDASASTTITGDNPGNLGWSVATGDANGDGYADVVASAYTYSSNTGRVYVFHSAGSAGVTITGAGSANTTISGETASDYLGFSVGTGDVNGDEYADLVVGAYGYSSISGRAYVFHSSGAAGVATTSAASANSKVTGEATGNYFGYSVAAGDANADGYADLVVGAFGYSSSSGRAYVFHSSGAAGVTTTSAASANSKVTGEASSSSGMSVAAGDANGDGYADVLVGAPTYSSNTGRAYVLHSSGTAGVTATLAASANSVVTGETGTSFGTRVAVGDKNGDSYADMVAGASGYSTNTGRVYTFHSSGSAGIAITVAGSANSTLTGEAIMNQFGASLAGGY